METLEQGDVVLCTVERIAGTTVFVSIEGNGEGTIITSEIAPGRIRNLRDYVVPKKKIVCKILRINDKKVELSLRRVSQKEQKEVLEKAQHERSYRNIFKSVLGDKFQSTIESIEKEERFYEFIEEIKENPKKLDKFVNSSDAKKILEIINSQKQKISTAKKEINFTISSPEGLDLIKEILGKAKNKDIVVKYISAGKYSLKKESENLKRADQDLRVYAEEIENFAKSNGGEFTIKEK